MDHLDPLIDILDADEKNLFSSHLKKSSRENNEIKLFNLITDGVERSPNEIIRKIYGKVDPSAADMSNAYHSLRKRLMSRIFQFIKTRMMSGDLSDHAQMPGTLAVCDMFIHRERVFLAKHFLKKAEKTASLYRQYDMLDLMYNFQLTHAHALGLDLNDVMTKSLHNARKIEIHRKLNFAAALIRDKLDEVRSHGHTLDPESVTKLVLDQLQIEESDACEPAFQFRILSIYRTAMISVRDYYDLEIYIESRYNKLKADLAFTKADQQTEQGFLFYLAHAQYRNRKFLSAEKTLKMAEMLISDKSFRANPFYLKMITLRAAMAANSGHNHVALELMAQHIHIVRKLTDSREQMNLILNYCVYCFNANDFKAASTLMREIDDIMRTSRMNMGKEWIFKKRMIHLIIRIELDSFDEVEKLMKGIKEDYAEFFKNPFYERAGIFLKLIEEYLKDPMRVSDPEFIHKVRNSGLAWPGPKEDIQAITFFCWLLSKMMKRPYYVTLMERMREDVSPEEFQMAVDFEERYGR